MEILFEDNHLIAINKTAGDIVQEDKTGDVSLEQKIKLYIKEKYKKPGEVFLGVIHRIDRPVTGVVLFARTSKALARMNELFQEKTVKKTYLAIVKNAPPAETSTLTNYIWRDSKKNKSFCVSKDKKDAKLASLTYTQVAASDNYKLLEIDLHTGRHHQIRCQLAQIGCPVRGDLKYGFPRSNKDGGISLHARQISFPHPVSKETITITAPVPNENIWKAFSDTMDNRS
jgi:23S rRNA pseudouridine1911/1915/1917 synthase